ncbi:hypothetical protein CWE15_00985 [Aliidiomarina taiwanensis]|uniref:YfcL family protein n=1 Tax=Aliidiomarina taiwanensis TaxID=946228 RepID=A0A432X8P9_9GAMM|nr:YfcL family protein [Aliidiomarina taiwanensis]RUO43805.1 hypothetical protein CWE15_00985 [Aliidiomarina taiwanensis]
MSGKTITDMSVELDAVFDDIIAQGNDDELFASGYLRGHFDLVVARLTMSGVEDQSQFWPALHESVAASAHELNEADLALVNGMLARLQSHT